MLPRPPASTGLVDSVATASPTDPLEPGTPLDPATLTRHGLVPASNNALYVTTDGDDIVFSGAHPELPDAVHGPNLYRAEPGNAPALVYENPRQDSDLLPIAADAGWVAFAEDNEAQLGDGAWILWLLPPGASEPIELDRRAADTGGPYPLVALNERHVVWQAITVAEAGSRATLVHLELRSMARRVLRADDPERYQWWDPALDGDRLVYTEVDYVHGDASSPSRPAELYAMLLDLSDPDAEPVRLDTSGRATEPAIAGDVVAWKEADNVFAWGTLTLHSLASGETRSIVTTPQGGLKTPSVGNRYVAFWGIDDTEFYVYDILRDEMVPIFQLAPDSPIGGAFRAEVAGDLLVWVQGTDAGPVIGWGRLPTVDDP
ncbi:MAG TPA: hypothetical protein VFM19_06610 [Candidatus Limnocylindria bacterium]|nr:hypothetical protein [Candidatus Limnocylindria bacterium]